MKKHRNTIAVLFSVILPIVGCVGGYWYGNQIHWVRLNSPPAKPSQIVGLGVENTPEGGFALVIQTINGERYYYQESGGPELWLAASEERVRWLEDSSGSCGVTPRPFIPPPPGKVMQCVEYVGPYAQQEPQVDVKQWILLNDGSLWKWSYPDSLIYAIIRRNILFGFLGLLAGGLIGATIFFAKRDNRSEKSDNLG
ncbi:hypothetical protein DWB58_31570 [candidate division KSB1 bacterium]|nr:hypothetical protein [candidate division KSB1 bacterium]